MGKKNGKVAALDIPVEFGGVSIGDSTTRIGIRIDRENCNLETADGIFCGHRLTGRVELGNGGDSPGQTRFVDETEVLEGVFDCKRIGFDSAHLSTGLTFNKKDIDMDLISRFAKGSGRLVILEVGEIPDDAPDDHEDQKMLPGELKAEGPWRDHPMSELFEGALLKSLKKAGITTVGELADYTSGEHGHLTEIEGIGPGKAAKIEDVMLQFWAENPDADKEEVAAK